MGIHARIEPGGYVTIDTTAWLEPRTAGPLDRLTTDLHTWAARHTDTGQPRRPDDPGDPAGTYRDWPALVWHWLTAHGESDLPEPVLISHAETRLDAQVWILLAAVPHHGKVAVVGINHDPPVVYADGCCDPWDWFQADDVEILCPAGHGWTWRTGRELVTDDLRFTTLTAVFGPDLDAPFTPAPHNAGDRTPWIRCPTCGRRCDVELPAY